MAQRYMKNKQNKDSKARLLEKISDNKNKNTIFYNAVNRNQAIKPPTDSLYTTEGLNRVNKGRAATERHFNKVRAHEEY